MSARPEAAGTPAWPLRPIALFALLTAAVLLAIMLFGQSEASELRGYLCLLVVGPFGAAALDAWLVRRLGAAAWEQAARHVVLASAGVLLLISLGALLRQFAGVALLQPLLSVLLLGLLAIAGLALAGRLPGGPSRGLHALDRCTVPLLLAALAIFCAIFAPLYPGRFPVSAFQAWLGERPLFGLLILAGWPLAFLLPGLPAQRGGPAAQALLAATLVFALLLYDDGLFRAYDHYMADVGPALQARRGGIPMVEVYSQYGLLPWAILDLAFRWLPETFGSAAAVVRLFTIAGFLAFLLTAYRLVQDKRVGLLLATLGLVWAITFPEQLFNLNGLPSTQGFRYLLPALVVLWLAWVPRGPWQRLGVAALVALASIYSLETFVYAAGTALAPAVLEALAERRARPLLPVLAMLACGTLLAQALFWAWLLAVYGRTPDYLPYFQIIANFGLGEKSNWSVPIDPDFGLWVPAALVLFVPLVLACRDALVRRRYHPRAWLLVPTAVLGIGEASYFVGRSTTTTLGLALLPLLLVALVGLDALLERWRAGTSDGGRSLQLGERALVALAIAVVFAFSTERFARPYDPSKGNATILRRCFTAEGCAPGAVVARLSAGVKERMLDIDESDPKHYELAQSGLTERLRELDGLLTADFPDSKRIPALIDRRRLPFLGDTLFAGRPQWYLGPVSSPLNDSTSPALADRIVATAQTLGPGQRLLVDREPEALLPIWQEFLAAVRARCRLERIDGGAFYDVLQVRACARN